MGKSLREKIKEQPIENQIQIVCRAHELIGQELTRQKLLLIITLTATRQRQDEP